LNFSPQTPALTNCARRISNLTGGCMIFRPPLADLIPENKFVPHFVSPEMNSQNARKLNSVSYFATARLPVAAAHYFAQSAFCRFSRNSRFSRLFHPIDVSPFSCLENLAFGLPGPCPAP